MSPSIPSQPRIEGWASSGALRLKGWSGRIPWGSQTAKMSAFTGLVESFLLNRGSPWQALQGGVLSWASAVGADMLNDWSDLPSDRGGPAKRLKPLIQKIASAGEVVPGMKSNPTVAGVIGAVIGAIQGLFTKTGEHGRWRNVWSSAFSGGVQRLVASWASDQVLEVAVLADNRDRPVVRPAIERWSADGPDINLDIEREKVPSRVIEDEHRELTRRLAPEHRRRLASLKSETYEGRKALYAWVGLEFKEPTHTLWLTNPDSDYKTDEKDRTAKFLFDLKGESFVRLQEKALRTHLKNLKNLLFVTQRALCRAEDSGNHIETRVDDQGVKRLHVKSGYREFEVRQPSSSSPEEKVLRSFDAAATDVISRLEMYPTPLDPATDYQVECEEGVEVKGPILGAIVNAYPEEQKKEFVRALMTGKKQMSLEPLIQFFAPNGCSDADRAVLRQEILLVNKDRLLKRRPPQPVHFVPEARSGTNPVDTASAS